MRLRRSAGVLLHPTSLPGLDGIGDVGPQAYRWVDWLAATGSTLWQVLPLGPTGYGDSPYQCFSAFAGNPYLVSPELLLQDGLLTADDLGDRPEFPADQVDFGPVIHWKLKLLDRAYERYLADPAPLRVQFESFQAQESSWLDDFALFMSIKEAQGGVAWEHWPEPLRLREPQALEEARQSEAVRRHAFRQFLFFRQWTALREYAHARGLRIIGDIPIFVAFDSADAWSHPELFYLDDERQPTIVAGVPPDYFSPTGQLWGNPLYRWEAHAQSNYAWWIDRMHATLKQVDIIRLDHFRGFAGYWAVPYGNPTAEIGEWRSGPGKPFLAALQQGCAHARLRPELPRLEMLLERGRANGVPGLERIGPPRLREIEPHAAGLAAIHSPETAVVDFREVAKAMAARLAEQGVLTPEDPYAVWSDAGTEYVIAPLPTLEPTSQTPSTTTQPTPAPTTTTP